MDARIPSAALKQYMVAISSPSLGESSLNDCATMAQPTELGVGYDIFEKPVLTSVAQKIWRGNKHAGRRDLRTRIRNKDGHAFAR
jgi:hypothetical protein